jgi:hypothetical protein
VKLQGLKQVKVRNYYARDKCIIGGILPQAFVKNQGDEGSCLDISIVSVMADAFNHYFDHNIIDPFAFICRQNLNSLADLMLAALVPTNLLSYCFLGWLIQSKFDLKYAFRLVCVRIQTLAPAFLVNRGHLLQPLPPSPNNRWS